MPQRSLRFFGRWEFKVNSLWLWWYCCLVLIAEGYLMYRAVTRCKEYNELPWDTQEKPVSELYAYICLIVVSVMCMPFFIITSIFKVGCYSNDGTRLGRDNVLHHLNVESNDSGAGTRARFLKDIWRHMGPLSQAFHILAAFALLLPMSMIEAQQIKFGFLKPEKMWSSELEVLYGTKEYRLKSPAPDIIANTTETPYNNNAARTTATIIESGPVVISAEFVNYVLSLVIYSLRYASVYWYTNAAFSASFAFALLLTSLHYVYAYCGLQILYKFEVNEHAVQGVSLLLPHGVLMALHVIASVITFVSPLSIFNYGYCHYVETCRQFLKKYFPTYARYVAKMPVGCHGYVPHIAATISLVLFVAFRSPVVYDYVNVYRATGFPVVLTCIIVDTCYMVLWIALWFVFTLKQTWQFRINPQMDMLNSIQRPAVAAGTQSATATPPNPPETETSFRDGDSNNNSRDGAVVHQPNTVQVIDRPPAYANTDTVYNQNGDKGRSQSKLKKQLPPLHIDTSEARMARSNNSPLRQNSPSRHQSPSRHSPNRHGSPHRHDSPQRQQSPHRNDSPHRQHSPSRHNSPQRQQSPQRYESPRTQSPHRQNSPERQLNIRHQSPTRQFSYPSTTDSNLPDTPATADTPNTPISPTSALKKSGLRKSGERRNNAHQRVTFDDSVDHIGDAKGTHRHPELPLDTGQLSPNSLRKRKVKSSPPDGSLKGSIPLQTLDILPVTSTNHAAFSGTTPDNTLTRNYRSSIRDKCGQYYKNLGDLGIPPAAQSSPIPYQQRPLSDNYDNRELLLSPLALPDKQGTHLSTPYSEQHQRNPSEIELTGYYENARSREQKKRTGRKAHDDDRHFSYPPQIAQQPPRPSVPAKNYTSNSIQANPTQSSSSRSVNRPHNQMLYDSSRDISMPTREGQKYARGISREIARDLNKQFSPISKPYQSLVSMHPNHRPELNREIKIIKPELNRRDSALPSSNETSSNDSSENVLCSQV